MSRETRLDLAVKVLKNILSGQREPKAGEEKALFVTTSETGCRPITRYKKSEKKHMNERTTDEFCGLQILCQWAGTGWEG